MPGDYEAATHLAIVVGLQPQLDWKEHLVFEPLSEAICKDIAGQPLVCVLVEQMGQLRRRGL
jgi:hypothetical protein